MKKEMVLFIALIVVNISVFAINIPKAVADAFVKKFPAATNIKWIKENAKEYEAEFKLNGKSVSANFLTDGSWVETEAEISIAELPVAVAAAVKTKHPGAVVLKAYKIETAKGRVIYETEIKTGNKKTEMILNADGTFVK